MIRAAQEFGALPGASAVAAVDLVPVVNWVSVVRDFADAVHSGRASGMRVETRFPAG